MHAYKLEKQIDQSGSLSLNGIPFHKGENVEVIILSKKKSAIDDFPLFKSKIKKYIDPTKPVAEDDWDVLK